MPSRFGTSSPSNRLPRDIDNVDGHEEDIHDHGEDVEDQYTIVDEKDAGRNKTKDNPNENYSSY